VRDAAGQVDNELSTDVVHIGTQIFHRAAHIVCRNNGHVRARTLMRLVSSVIWL
jgi:hypothetical protein